MQGELRATRQAPFAELVRDGLGQLTRVFGTGPVPPADALRTLRELQAQIVAASRFGIPAVAHEECLTGFAAWQATVYPTPLAWGATFDPGAGRARWPRPIGARHARARRPPGPGAGARRRPRHRAGGGSRRPSARTPTWSASIGTAYVRGPGVGRGRRHAQALRRLLGLAGRRATMAPVSIGRARARRRDPAAVRDGAARGRRALGDELLHRHRRRARRPPTAGC